MVVEHHVEAVFDTIVHNLLHAVHPFRINIIVRVAMHIPRTGYAHGAEALGLHEVDNLLRGLRALPGSLPVDGVADPVAGTWLHRIAEVPAGVHIGGHLHGGGLRHSANAK